MRYLFLIVCLCSCTPAARLNRAQSLIQKVVADQVPADTIFIKTDTLIIANDSIAVERRVIVEQRIEKGYSFLDMFCFAFAGLVVGWFFGVLHN